MAGITIDPDELDASIKRVLEAPLKSDGNSLIDLVQDTFRPVLRDVQAATDGFREKARTELGTGETAVEEFKKKLSDTLNVKFFAVYAAFLLIASLAAAGYLADRAQIVVTQSNEFS